MIDAPDPASIDRGIRLQKQIETIFETAKFQEMKFSYEDMISAWSAARYSDLELLEWMRKRDIERKKNDNSNSVGI